MYMRGKIKYSILDLTGSEWKRVRNLQSPFFTSGKLKRVNYSFVLLLESHQITFLTGHKPQQHGVKIKHIVLNSWQAVKLPYSCTTLHTLLAKTMSEQNCSYLIEPDITRS